MPSIDAINALKKIAECWHADGSLSDPILSGFVNELKLHPSFVGAVKRLSSPNFKLGLEELFDNSDRRVSVACSSGNWHVSAVMNYVVDTEIILSPFPMIIAPANGTSIEIDLYEYSPENFTKSLDRDLRLGTPFERKTIEDGQFWATPARGIFADTVRVVTECDDREPVIMVISGEAYAPYVRVFDRSGNITSTVFSSNKYNSQQFFADFVKNVTNSDFLNDMSQKEKQNLYSFIEKELSEPSGIVSESLWPMVQTAANLDRSLGLCVLEKVANSSHELASRASKVLENNTRNKD